MRRARRALETTFTFLALSFFTTGCVNAAFSNARVAGAERHDVWLHRYAYGLVGTRELDTRRYCARGAAEARVFESGSTLTLTVLTLGIYSPEVARITCGAEMGRSERGRAPHEGRP
jgi:hypothetical protein